MSDSTHVEAFEPALQRAAAPADGAERQLVILAQYFWPEAIGSAPYCTDLAVWLAARGFRVTVVTGRPHYPRRDLYPAWQDGSRDRETFRGVSILRVPTRGRLGAGLIGRILGDLAFSAGAARVLAELEAGTLHGIVGFVPSVLSLLPARALARRTGAPITAVVHDIESGLAGALGIATLKPLVSCMRALERTALSGSTQIVVLSEAMRRELQALGLRRPVHVLPIWTQVPPSEADDTATPRPVTLMYSGNFGKKQNLDQLVPLIASLRDHAPPVRVVLQGDGSERPRIAAQLRELDARHVEFRELVPADQLFASLRSADVHLVPQALRVASYAVPSKVFSIMAAARPFVAIAEDASPLQTLARDSGCGVCVRPGDEAGLLREVERLTCDPGLRRAMGQRGRAYVMSNMLRSDVLDRYADILRGGPRA